jgi:hypothetical protein
MLTSASGKGDLEGLVPYLVENGLTHLQYADDTIIFLKNSERNIRNMKFVLYCFEASLVYSAERFAALRELP